jgi:chromosomal replication initiation ATPase DnaA
VTPAVRAVVRDVADETGINTSLIMGRSRLAPIAAARHEAIRRVHRATMASGAELGRWFSRDPKTIAYVLDQVRR